MINHEYKIPAMKNDAEAKASSVSFSPPTDSELMHNYLRQIQTKQESDRTTEKIKNIISLSQILEQTREQHIQETMYSTRQRRLSAIVDYMISGVKVKKYSKDDLWSKLVDTEARIGGQLLDTRDTETHYYHYHDQNEWFWYAENNTTGEKQSIRYKVDMYDGLSRSVNAGVFEQVSQSEFDNFLEVSRLYTKHVLAKVYARHDLTQA